MIQGDFCDDFPPDNSEMVSLGPGTSTYILLVVAVVSVTFLIKPASFAECVGKSHSKEA